MGGHGLEDKFRNGIIKGHVTYSMSPFHQKPLFNYFQNGIPETVKRLKGWTLYAFPPIILGIYFDL